MEEDEDIQQTRESLECNKQEHEQQAQEQQTLETEKGQVLLLQIEAERMQRKSWAVGA